MAAVVIVRTSVTSICVSVVLYCNQKQIECLVETVQTKLESILVTVSTFCYVFLTSLYLTEDAAVTLVLFCCSFYVILCVTSALLLNSLHGRLIIGI